MKILKSTIIASVLLFLLVGSAIYAGSRDNVTRTFENKDRVKLNTVSGDCMIKVGSDDKIEVILDHSYSPRRSFKPIFEERGNTLALSEEIHGPNSGYSEWTLIVPQGTRIDFSTASGDFVVKGLEARVHATTASGNVEVIDGAGTYDLLTASGNIELEDFNGEVEAGTASGSIRVYNVSGDIDLDAASGNIDINGAHGVFEVNCASGNIEVSDIVLESRSSFEVASGDVDVVLAEAAAHDLVVASASGNALLDYNGHPVKGSFEFVSRYRGGKIRCPFDFEDEERFRLHGQEYVSRVFSKDGQDPEITIKTGSGRATLRE